MVTKIKSIGLFGLNGYAVDVEVDISSGMPTFDIVGLPDTAVKEAKERVKSAIKNSGYRLPVSKIVVNLAPADVKKEGSVFDLPVLIGILKATGLEVIAVNDCIFCGELSLSGEIRAVNGILPTTITAKTLGARKIFVPKENEKEASVVEGIEVYPASHISEIIQHLKGEKLIQAVKPPTTTELTESYEAILDFADVCGQEIPKRAVEIAAAGSHNILFIGSPGSGKSMIAKRIPGILPPMTTDEKIECSKIHSIAGLLDGEKGLIKERPFRSPHHTISRIGLSGGGRIPSPGELSLAHNGVLFLDELPEFGKDILEVLRQPLEDGKVAISRAAGTLTFPCEIMLVAAMNPCRCGYFGHPTKQCSCSESSVKSYLSKISGPLLDRFDIQIEVPPVKYSQLRGKGGSTSKDIRERVKRARLIQQERYKNLSFSCNARITTGYQKEFCKLSLEAENFLKLAFEKLQMTARAYERVLKIARTIADLEGETDITVTHLAEAVNYRSLDKKYF